MKATVDGVTYEGTEDEISWRTLRRGLWSTSGSSERRRRPLCGQTTSRATGTARRKSRARGNGTDENILFSPLTPRSEI